MADRFEIDDQTAPVRIGVSGTGFIARGLLNLLAVHPRFRPVRVLTRRPLNDITDISCRDIITRDLGDFIEHSDLVVECSGSPYKAYAVIESAFAAGRPVVTMNAEFQVTAGSFFNGAGSMTEAQGDQPGSIAALATEVRSMGFTPLVYGSQKGFLNLTPKLEDMRDWATRSGNSVPTIVAFTDGTKVQIEQAVVANGLGAEIACRGMLGPEAADWKSGALSLAEQADRLGYPLADYVLQPGGNGDVFVVATHDASNHEALRYYKLGDGPYYVLSRPYHLGHFEAIMTIERALAGATPLLTNGPAPRYSVAAVAKRKLSRGDSLPFGIGSFEVRGEAVAIADEPNHLPIGLIENCEIAAPVEPGQILELSDITMAEGKVPQAWRSIRDRAVGEAGRKRRMERPSRNSST